MANPPPMLSIVIVSWNTRALLSRALASIEAQGLVPPPEVIVVDNGSDDGSAPMVRDRFPTVRLIEPGENLGYSAGNNRGLRAATGDPILLLNPDTELHPGALAALLGHLEANAHVGLVGPRLRYATGAEQLSRHRFPSLLTLFVASTPLDRALAGLLRGYYLTAPVDEPQPVDWLSGAALMVRRAVVEGVGGLDERFFMYFEETDWQRRIKEAGWSIHFMPDALVTHHEDAAGGQVVAARHRRFNRSRLRYTARWHGARWAILLRGWLLLLFGVEWLKEAGKWLVGHKRPLRRDRLVAYGALLRTTLEDR